MSAIGVPCAHRDPSSPSLKRGGEPKFLNSNFQGTLYTFARVAKRREDFKDLRLCIDFDHIRLLDDTVTKTIITRQPDDAAARSEML